MNIDETDLVPLSETEIETKLKELPEWRFADDKIVRTMEFRSFTEAIQFINGLVLFCNMLDHHPDMMISYKKVRFELTRFSVGGKVTARDFTVAQKIEDDYRQYQQRQVS